MNEAKDTLLSNPDSVYHAFTYRPGCTDLTVIGREAGALTSTDRRLLNLWTPADVKPIVPEDGEKLPILELFDHWFGPDDDEIKGHFLNTLACIVQRPAVKQMHAFLFISSPGAGKGALRAIMEKILGRHNVARPSSKQLDHQEFGFLEQKQAVFYNETMTGDNRSVGNALKEIITEPTISVRKLYRDAFDIENLAYNFFFSNHGNPVFLEEKDRRFAVHRIEADNMPETFFTTLYESIESERGPGLFLHFLMSRDISKYNPNAAPPMTMAKQDVTYSSKSEVLKRIEALYEAGTPPFNQTFWLLEELTDTINATLEGTPGGLGGKKSKATINDVRDFVKSKGGGRVKDEAIALKQGRTEVRTRYWCIRDADKWRGTSLEEIREQHSRETGCRTTTTQAGCHTTTQGSLDEGGSDGKVIGFVGKK